MRGHLKWLTQIAESLLEWIGALLPLFRVLIPVIMLNIMIPGVHAVYIPELGIEISSVAMHCIVIGVHTIAAWAGMQSEGSRGWSYEIASCFLATEIVLFIYFMQYQFAIALLLVIIYSAGLVWISTYGRRRLMYSYRRGHIPQTLMDDIIASSREKRRPYTVFSVALRRFMMIVPAVLLIAASIVMIYNHGLDGTKHTGKNHAIIADSQENQLIANLSTLQLLEDSSWELLSDQEKVDVLQVIADIETHYMKIVPVTVVNCHLENRTIGVYDHSQRQAQIDLDKHIGYESLEYVNTILHECRHAYQHDCVDSLDWSDTEVQTGIYFSEVRNWRYEHANYVSASEDRDVYYNQWIEKDARHYAEEDVYVYQQYIYLGNLPTR